nr:60S ribosomal protein L7a-like [Aegilops tauschii subsp. strangulata]
MTVLINNCVSTVKLQGKYRDNTTRDEATFVQEDGEYSSASDLDEETQDMLATNNVGDTKEHDTEAIHTNAEMAEYPSLDKVVNPLFEKRPKQFGIGGALLPKKDLHRFVKWPKVMRIQRQRRILKQCLKVPQALHEFTRTLDKNLAK